MSHFDGVTPGPISIARTESIRGTIDGDVNVQKGGKLLLYGTVSGSVRIEAGGEAMVYGVVAGAVQNNGSVYIAGMVLKGVSSTATATVEVEKEAVVLGRSSISAWL